MPRMNIEVDDDTDKEILQYQHDKRMNEDVKLNKAKVAAELIKKGLEAIKKEKAQENGEA
ncbi:hypothetical protein [Microscilla marina]|nr:hypothetical protein [Microscilla marina]